MSLDTIKLVLSGAADGRTKDFRYRQRQMHSLHNWMLQHAQQIEAAAQTDDGLSETESRYLTTLLLNETRRCYITLDLKKELREEYSVKYGRDWPNRTIVTDATYLVPERKLLLFNVLSVLSVCISAGSCCVVELQPESTSSSSSVLQDLFNKALDKTAFGIIHQRPSVAALSRFLLVDQIGAISEDMKHDLSKLIVSDINAVSAAIVDRTADVDLAAREIVKARAAFSGWSQYAPSHVLVNEFVEAEFIAALAKYSPPGSSLSQSHGSEQNKESDVAVYGEFRLKKLPDRSFLGKSLHHPKEQTVVLLSTSSHDDTIDALADPDRRPLLALYVFAAPPAAKYLAQFIHTRISFFNHIPTNMLARPAAPIGYPVDPVSPFSRAMIELASPQFIHSNTDGCSLRDLRAQDLSVWRGRYMSAVRPLPPIVQPPEGGMDFFTQGFVAGIIFYVVPLTVVAGLGSTMLARSIWKWAGSSL